MQLTKEYIAECEDCVYRNYKQIDGDRKSQRVQERIKIINPILFFYLDLVSSYVRPQM